MCIQNIANIFKGFWICAINAPRIFPLLQYSKMFCWELEGRYRCTKSMAIAPFWFSTKHLWILSGLLALNWRYVNLPWELFWNITDCTWKGQDKVQFNFFLYNSNKNILFLCFVIQLTSIVLVHTFGEMKCLFDNANSISHWYWCKAKAHTATIVAVCAFVFHACSLFQHELWNSKYLGHSLQKRTGKKTCRTEKRLNFIPNPDNSPLGQFPTVQVLVLLSGFIPW